MFVVSHRLYKTLLVTTYHRMHDQIQMAWNGRHLYKCNRVFFCNGSWRRGTGTRLNPCNIRTVLNENLSRQANQYQSLDMGGAVVVEGGGGGELLTRKSHPAILLSSYVYIVLITQFQTRTGSQCSRMQQRAFLSWGWGGGGRGGGWGAGGVLETPFMTPFGLLWSSPVLLSFWGFSCSALPVGPGLIILLYFPGHFCSALWPYIGRIHKRSKG